MIGEGRVQSTPLLDVIHEAIKTHGDPGSPGWQQERRQAERILTALAVAGYKIAPARVQ